jgi:hypothetical protein
MYELDALRKLHNAASDYILGTELPEFAEHCGGMSELFQKLVEANLAYEAEFNTTGGDHDRRLDQSKQRFPSFPDFTKFSRFSRLKSEIQNEH